MSRFFKSRNQEIKKSRNQSQGIYCKIKNLQKSWSILAVVLVCSLGLVYLIEINSIATKGFEMKELEKKIASLKEQNKKLDLDVTELQSTEKIQKRVDKLGLVASNNVGYIKVGSSTVAVK